MSHMKGRAAVLTEPRGRFAIEEFPVPDPEPGAVLIKVTLANVCGSDLHIWRGDLQQELPFTPEGTILGHEMTGVVAALGAGVTRDSAGEALHEGDRVTYCYFNPCGQCYQCLRGERATCPFKMRNMVAPIRKPPHFNGAFADYYYLRPGMHLFKVPDTLSDELVAPVNCALSQVIYGFERAGLGLGDTVVIQGAGGLGLNATAVAREMGAAVIIVIDGIAGRLALARAFGADHTIDIAELPTPEARVQRVKEITRRRGADVVAELVGLPAVIPEGLKMLRYGGTYLELGCISYGHTVALDPSLLVYGGKRMIGMIQYEPAVLARAIDLLNRTRDRYPFARVLSHRFPLEEIDAAFARAEWLGRDAGGAEITRATIVMG